MTIPNKLVSRPIRRVLLAGVIGLGAILGSAGQAHAARAEHCVQAVRYSNYAAQQMDRYSDNYSEWEFWYIEWQATEAWLADSC